MQVSMSLSFHQVNIYQQEFFLEDTSKQQLPLPILMMMFGGLSMIIIANCIAAFHTRQEWNMSGLSRGLVILLLFVAL